MLQAQVLEDVTGIPMGVFIPMPLWEEVKIQYPDIENYDIPLPLWEKGFIDDRLTAVHQNPDRLKPIETLYDR
ncbi:hypothetical protein SAMD00024442_4_74 [Candidatus Symbiothrix dinenymphae]|nr:hypothetical protein SAMD00024442_4_74 [Candidatus Symbiothrix dinenymphae]